MKKIKCKRCGHEIILGIDDEERIFTCCGKPMAEITETVSYRNAGSEAARLMVAEQSCNGFTGTQGK
ncbi:MAG: hypothetical protein LBV20_02260 [Treponema sp.]|nr:hypothetical protein [Treponema sp.]